MNTLLGTLAAIPQATALALFAMAILLYGAIAKPQSNLSEYSRRRAGVSDSRALGFCSSLVRRRLPPSAAAIRMDAFRSLRVASPIRFAAAVSLPLGLPRQQSLQLEGFEQLPRAHAIKRGRDAACMVSAHPGWGFTWASNYSR